MDARTVRKLLQCVQSQQERVSLTDALKRFIEEHPTVGRRQGTSWYLNASDRDRIGGLLRAEGVDPATPPDAWNGISRTEALALGNNEKFTRARVQVRRVAIKSIRPDMPLFVGQNPIVGLPPRCHVEADYNELSLDRHDWIVVVENWECFCDIHVAAARLAFPGEAPLVMWRGDTSSTRADNVNEVLRRAGKPVAGFFDYDPEGLLIAARLPRLDAVIAPALDDLRELVSEHGQEELYSRQIHQCQRALDALGDSLVSPIWSVIWRHGKGLPQEHFVRPLR